MQLHNITRTVKNKKQKRIGRGGKRGTYSGRGIKGQNARSGHRKRPELRDIIKKIPKLRGRGKSVHTSIQVKAKIINLALIEKAFSVGEKVTPQAVIAKRLVRVPEGTRTLKILGDGTLTKKLSFSGFSISHKAVEKITKAGGTIQA